MIVNNKRDLKREIDIITGLNKQYAGGYLVKDMLSSIFSASPYIDDIKDDISTIVYNISEDQCFSDGNKRTALLYLVDKSDKYKLRLKAKDIQIAELLKNFISDRITKEEFISEVWY